MQTTKDHMVIEHRLAGVCLVLNAHILLCEVDIFQTVSLKNLLGFRVNVEEAALTICDGQKTVYVLIFCNHFLCFVKRILTKHFVWHHGHKHEGG